MNLAEISPVVIAALVGAIIGPVVMLILNKLFSKKSDNADLSGKVMDIANKAVDELRQYQKESIERESDMQKKIDRLEAAVNGPFLLTIKFRTLPSPEIMESKITVEPKG